MVTGVMVALMFLVTFNATARQESDGDDRE